MSIVIIDDQDVHVTRTGNWSLLGSQVEYLRTTTITDSLNSTIRVRFYGSEIGIYGTRGTGTTILTAKIDDQPPLNHSVVSIDDVLYHQNFFTLGELSGELHTLTLTTATPMRCYIDYFLVNASSAASANASGWMSYTGFLDDADTSSSIIFKYDGAWDATDIDVNLQSTAHNALDSSSTTATISFNASSRIVYGSAPLGTWGDLAVFSLFSGTGSEMKFIINTTYTFPTDPAPGFVKNVAGNLPMYMQSNLAGEPHTLVIHPTNSNFSLDYMTFVGLVPLSLDMGMASTATSTQTLLSSSVVGSTSSTSTTGTTSVGSGTDPDHRDVGVIVGPVVAGLIALSAFAILGSLFIRRHRRARARNNGGASNNVEEGDRNIASSSESLPLPASPNYVDPSSFLPGSLIVSHFPMPPTRSAKRRQGLYELPVEHREENQEVEEAAREEDQREGWEDIRIEGLEQHRVRNREGGTREDRRLSRATTLHSVPPPQYSDVI